MSLQLQPNRVHLGRQGHPHEAPSKDDPECAQGGGVQFRNARVDPSCERSGCSLRDPPDQRERRTERQPGCHPPGRGHRDQDDGKRTQNRGERVDHPDPGRARSPEAQTARGSFSRGVDHVARSIDVVGVGYRLVQDEGTDIIARRVDQLVLPRAFLVRSTVGEPEPRFENLSRRVVDRRLPSDVNDGPWRSDDRSEMNGPQTAKRTKATPIPRMRRRITAQASQRR